MRNIKPDVPILVKQMLVLFPDLKAKIEIPWVVKKEQFPKNNFPLSKDLESLQRFKINALLH